MKIVVDTNVYINAIFHDDKWAQDLLRMIKNGRVTLAVSDKIVEELAVVFMLHSSKRGSNFQMRRPLILLFKLIALAQIYIPSNTFPAFKDKDDNKFFDCAYEADAEVIVSYDAHLSDPDLQLVTKSGKPVNVLTPYQFIKELNKGILHISH